MPSVGEQLRCERVAQKRTVAEMAALTCISARYLAAIEQENPEILPGAFFLRSFVRQYADALGFDEDQTRKMLDALGPAPIPDPFPALDTPRQIAEVELRSKPLAHIPTRVAAMLFLLVLLGCSGLSALWNRAQEAADPDLQNAVSTKRTEVPQSDAAEANAPSARDAVLSRHIPPSNQPENTPADLSKFPHLR